MRETEKVFELAGNKYKVIKVTALEGSNLLRMVSSSGTMNPQEFLSKLSTKDFKEVQNLLIPFIYKINVIKEEGNVEREMVTPIMLSSGVIDKSANDAGTLYMLTVVCLVFNIANFFDESVLKEFGNIMEGFSTLTQ